MWVDVYSKVVESRWYVCEACGDDINQMYDTLRADGHVANYCQSLLFARFRMNNICSVGLADGDRVSMFRRQ